MAQAGGDISDAIMYADAESAAHAGHTEGEVLNKATSVVTQFITASGCYKEVEFPDGHHEVWLDGDTNWGYSPLGNNTPEFNAVSQAVADALKASDVQGSRNTLSPRAIRAAQMVSRVTFPDHDPEALTAKGLPRVNHGQNAMLVPSGALAVEVALRSAQQYFLMKTRGSDVSSQMQADVEVYLGSHALDAHAPTQKLESDLRRAANYLIKHLPAPVRQARYNALVTSLLVNERSDIARHVLGDAVTPLPTIEEIMTRTPPVGQTPGEIFSELTGHALDSAAQERLDTYLHNIVRDRVLHAVHRQVSQADLASDHQRPSLSKMLNNVLENLMQPSGFMMAFSPSYHGATAATVGSGAGPKTYGEHTFKSDRVMFVPTPYPYRQQGAQESEPEYVARLLRDVERKILLAGGKGSVAAIMIEPVSGSSLGGIPVPKGYLEGLRDLSEKYGPQDGKILLIYDEVMCGMGRTGTFAAFQHPDISNGNPVKPDVILYSKALHSGAEQAAAVVFNPEVIADMNKHGVHIEYSTTTMNFPPAAAAVETTIQQLQEPIRSGDLMRQGEALRRQIEERITQSDILREHVGELRGFGHMLGIELVNNAEEKEQIKKGFDLSYLVYEKALLEEGLGTLPVRAGRNEDGSLENSDTVFLLPPYVMKDIDVNRMAKKLVRAMEKAVAEVKGISLPASEATPISEEQVAGITRAVVMRKHYHDKLVGVRLVDDGAAVECELHPKDERSLQRFRQSFMEASGGYTARRDGDNWVFYLTAEQAEDLLAYEQSVSKVFARAAA